MKQTFDNIYLIGIGGIGMSAIARYYKFKGANVSGYDRTPSDLTRALESEGIAVHYTDDCSMIPQDVEKTLVVYTPAVPADFGELTYTFSHGYKVIKRSRMLGEITAGQHCMAVAGTHGKTTTSTMIAHILTESGEGCSAFLGGISKNYGTNMLVSDTPVVVAEADEYDRSFLQLHPAIAVITAIDADHLDIYGDLEHVQEAFRTFASQVSETIIVKKGLDIGEVSAKVFTYHLSDQTANCYAENIRLGEDGLYTYDLVYPGGVLKDIKVGAPGLFNIENSIGAASACLCHGVDAQKVRKAIGSFCGARRRLDMQVNKTGCTYIDDYAHHPAEIETSLSAVRQIYPSRKLTVVFQPHLFTRTRDFAPEFAKALSLADKLIMLDIYPAREEPIPGVTSDIIFKDVTCPEKILVHREDFMKHMEGEEVDVLMTVGAGDIDRFVEPLRKMLETR